jgi:hypothetical protein
MFRAHRIAQSTLPGLLIEAIETLRAWYLQDEQDKDRTEKDIRLKEEQEVISEAIGGGGGEIVENCS